MEECLPEIVFAKATEITVLDWSRRTTLEYDGSIDEYESSRTTTVGLSYEVDGKQHFVRETFDIGEVTPKIGQWVRGVLVCNQWGSYHFITTHVLRS